MNDKTNDTIDIVRAAVMICALASLALICGHFILRAFGVSTSAGLRSMAGVLLPFVVGGFLVAFNRSVFERVARVPSMLAFTTALAFGIVVMLLLENASTLASIPVAELVVASGLSLFLYTPGAVMTGKSTLDHREVWVAYYFGVVSGMLGYVVIIGFPSGGG
ncbi:MAG: hypothetical protein OEW35_07680 [Gammaproteobacteria bacterium]|nr:hypothetical protein [Gammaproteobacteria bacterium]MDH4256748.1 hypothetical protein [Gammaproteobacteria bacterium]MDH5311280.1 hypothetical protein [Gammaproteobacteria bacterium]